MIVLDTNVIFELMRPEPRSALVAWVANQPRSSLYAPNINRTEILYGVTMMPPGRRRDWFALIASAIFAEEFTGRVLPFDGVAADYYARIVRKGRGTGMPIESFDALIAAMTAAAGYSIATRNVGGFEACGLTIINPWQAAG
jgi:hypothetical protein